MPSLLVQAIVGDDRVKIGIVLACVAAELPRRSVCRPPRDFGGWSLMLMIW